ncbi:MULTISPECIES: VPLPA-CTERM sorting domain-containing protein [Methylomonas]|uniref:PEP-CTERM protein-sorting domain-containing protein n=2 Tax=Methylomonas TaxID=416 RepID=A0A140E4K2_9GAMM|nr:MULTISPECIES: PEP-CTERM domain protein [Methylomonas]AMK75326.1 hypothetical protein JT25_002285 [Methylomonas denitrificans]OAH99282.1 hypothetical protein A1342_03930 [Methylomonas methanica]TCV84927.1 putative secreted protein [Methylomonas methanica]
MKIKTALLTMSILSLMAFNTGAAANASATAEVTVDWSSFRVTSGTEVNAGIAWYDKSSRVDTRLDTPYGEGTYSSDWVTPLTSLQTGSGIRSITSKADVDPNILHSYSQDIDPAFGDAVTTESYRTGSFTGSGSGATTFSVDYSMNVGLLPGSGTNDVAAAWVLLVVNDFGDPNRSLSSRKDLFLNANFVGSFPNQASGTLSVTLPTTSIGRIFFKVTTHAYANVSGVSQVPLPATAWLFGSALLAMVGARRRQVSAAAGI